MSAKVTSHTDLINRGFKCVSINRPMRTSEWHRYDEGTGQLHIMEVQHGLEELLASNAEHYNNSLGSKWGDGKVVARIPLPIFYEHFWDALMAKDWKSFKRKINDGEFSKLRTFKGNI